MSILSPPTPLLLLLVSLLGLLVLRAPAPAEWAAASTPQGMMLVEDKARLGSTPPSCRNRCNACAPCVAVQVPSMPGEERVRQQGLGRKVATPMDVGGGSNYGGYPYYKPLGWKCRCGGHFFNP